MLKHFTGDICHSLSSTQHLAAYVLMWQCIHVMVAGVQKRLNICWHVPMFHSNARYWWRQRLFLIITFGFHSDVPFRTTSQCINKVLRFIMEVLTYCFFSLIYNRKGFEQTVYAFQRANLLTRQALKYEISFLIKFEPLNANLTLEN